MFKRLDRRRRRNAEEEEVGIDEDMKEVMGLNNTDSSESDSDSDSDSDADLSSGQQLHPDSNASEGGLVLEKEVGKSLKRKRTQAEDADETDDGSEAEEPSPDEESDEDEGITIASALREPIHIIDLDVDIRACVFCPGKLLKNPRMIEVHESSKAHQRRLKRAQELSMGLDPEEDISAVLSRLDDEKNSSESAPPAESKRAVKRKAKQAAIREKREKKKAKKAAGIKTKKAKKATKAVNEEDAAPVEAGPNHNPSTADLNSRKGSEKKPQKSATNVPSKSRPPKEFKSEGEKGTAKKRRAISNEDPKKDGSKSLSRSRSASRYFDEKKKTETERGGGKSERKGGKEHMEEKVLHIFD